MSFFPTGVEKVMLTPNLFSWDVSLKWEKSGMFQIKNKFPPNLKYYCQKFSVKGSSDNNPLLALQYSFFLSLKVFHSGIYLWKIATKKKWTNPTVKTEHAFPYLHEGRKWKLYLSNNLCISEPETDVIIQKARCPVMSASIQFSNCQGSLTIIVMSHR